MFGIPSHMLHVWYTYLQNWVILFGHMLGFIFEHHGAYGHDRFRAVHAATVAGQVLSSSELNLFVQIATSGDSTVAAAIGKRYLWLGNNLRMGGLNDCL